MESFASRLEFALKYKNISQSELSERIDCSKSAISKYLKGKIIPRQTSLFLIAEALNVSPAWLMGYDVPMNDTKQRTLRDYIYNKVDLLSEADLQKLWDIMNIIF